MFSTITSASVSLLRMEEYTTTHSISCKPILPIRHLYKITTMRKAAATTSEMTTMKTTPMTTMKLMNRKEKNNRLGVAGTVVLIVI